MKTLVQSIWLALLAAAVLQPAPADAAGGARRAPGGVINYAPQPAVYEVTFVDAKTRTLRLRDEDGRTGSVQVAAGVYDLSKLKAGDRVRIDFAVPEAPNSPLRAATVWPAN